MGDLKNRKRTNLSFDNTFWEWIGKYSKETGIPISQLLEKATIKQYKDEYEEFLKNKANEGGAEK